MWEKLDFWFPFIVFTYGLVTLIGISLMTRYLRSYRSHPSMERLLGRESLAWTCLVVGALWSAQNLLLS